MVFESRFNVVPDVDRVSSNTSMLNDVEVATDLNTISCSSQVLSSSDVPEVTHQTCLLLLKCTP